MPLLPRFEAVRPPDMRPSLWARLQELRTPPASCAAQGALDFPEMVRRAQHEGEPELPAFPELAELGHDLLAAGNETHVRRLGCVWLTMFPSLATVKAMRKLTIDAAEPLALRDQAAWTLGFRQLGTRHPSLFWAPEVVRAADEALLEALDALPREGAPEHLAACRHVASPEVLDRMAGDVVAFAPGIEAFATEKLARACLARLTELPPEHGARIIRLIAATLKDEAVPALVAHAETTPSLPDKVEAIHAVLALLPDRVRALSEAFLAALVMPGELRARARWHEEHPRAFVTVDMLRVARTTATLTADERAPRARAACEAIAGYASLGQLSEPYLYAMWQKLAFLAKDAGAVVACVEAHSRSLETSPFLLRPYLEALAARGRFDELAKVAVDHAGAALAVWLLATHGRPFRALAMRGFLSVNEPEAVAGEALALFLAGRPDLAEGALSGEAPLAGDERAADDAWLPSHPEASSLTPTGAREGLRGGLPALLGAIRGAPDDADGDVIDLELLARFERRLRRELAGASVCFVGKVEGAGRLRKELAEKGARVVSGPFVGTDFFIAGEGADTKTLARLAGMGARPLPHHILTKG